MSAWAPSVRRRQQPPHALVNAACLRQLQARWCACRKATARSVRSSAPEPGSGLMPRRSIGARLVPPTEATRWSGRAVSPRRASCNPHVRGRVHRCAYRCERGGRAASAAHRGRRSRAQRQLTENSCVPYQTPPRRSGPHSSIVGATATGLEPSANSHVHASFPDCWGALGRYLPVGRRLRRRLAVPPTSGDANGTSCAAPRRRPAPAVVDSPACARSDP